MRASSKTWSSFLLALAMIAPAARAEVKRVVIIKVDGLPERFIERYAAETGQGVRAGRSRLPWIDQVFAKNGAWLENFYARGLSLSAPSWSMLDTGQHLEVRGNAEYDRYTLTGWDHLNFFPFYLAYGFNQEADMRGVELLDDMHVPLLIDRFPYKERYESFQLFQRGARLNRLQDTLTVKFANRKIKDLFDEWETGFTMSDSVGQEMERELLTHLKDPQIRYLDLYSGDYDHVAHLTNDRVAQFHVIEALDSLIGRVWNAIEASPYPQSTMVVLVSDHGMNTEEGVYSQGYNLIDWFNSPAGGSHHVLNNRHPMSEFKLKGLDPFVSEVISPSSSATYLAGESAHYPTCVMDLDGNERGSISIRNNSLNVIQILLDQLMRKKVAAHMRVAVLNALFATIDRVRPEWKQSLDQFDQEWRVLETMVARQQKIVDTQPKKWTKEDRAGGLDDDAAREVSRLYRWKIDLRGYGTYISTMHRLLALDPADFDPGKFKMEDFIPRKSLGEANTVDDMRHYVTGIAPGGLVLASDGSLDTERSFRHVDYFTGLTGLTVRNNVQKEVAPRPIDFIAVAMKNSVLLWKSNDRQAQIDTRKSDSGHLELRYSRVGGGGWVNGLPLEIFEDPAFEVPGDRAEWLSQWHDERDWLRAVHRTKYSNGVIGIVEEMLPEPVPVERELEPLFVRERQLRRPDLIAFANDHWNFNVRGFNPGGNHGSFLRVSTHSVLMFAGGSETGLPRGIRVAEPYDSLSLVPTILKLMGRPEPSLPGPVIQEVVH